MIDQKRKDVTEGAILFSYAQRMKDPAELRGITDKKASAQSADAFWDSF